MDPVETNRYLRVNRDELVADTNMSVAGSVVSQNPITNPVQTDSGAYLLSRVGGSDRLPTPGYCLHFDSTNPDVYIQTLIPSSSVSDWNIIIRGIGTSDFISTDSTGTNIAFRLNATLGSTDYYDLSYIAFVNNETGKIDHLFECEENGGLDLYDAVTGDIAFLTTDGIKKYVPSLSTLRGTSDTKEYIKNIDDAVNGTSCCGTWCNAVGCSSRINFTTFGSTITSGTLTNTGMSFIPNNMTSSNPQFWISLENAIPKGSKVRIDLEGFSVKGESFTNDVRILYGTGSSDSSYITISNASGSVIIEDIRYTTKIAIMPLLGTSTTFDGVNDSIEISKLNVIMINDLSLGINIPRKVLN